MTPPPATATVDPVAVGLDPARLLRLDRRLARYVDEGLLAGWQVVVSRHGEVAHASTYGQRDREAGLAVTPDTIWRIYSMTKPITSVAALTLYEQGAFQLTDPISRWLPEFAEPRVFTGGSALRPVTVAAVEPIRIWHLLTHTAGLTYGWHRSHPVDALYRAAGFDWGIPADLDLAGCCERWAALPLLFQPGTEWNYSVATDVLGRLVEVLTGQPLDEALAATVTGPLGMSETGFGVPSEHRHRLAALYSPDPATGRAVRNDALAAVATGRPRVLLGGGGMVSTAADYLRFCEMLRRGGALDGVRVLGPRTVAYLGRNHLPGGADLAQLGRPVDSETRYEGVGFGLGVAVVLDAAAGKGLSNEGQLHWGGAASTAFLIDPDAGLSVLLFTQLLPSSTHPLRPLLRQLVYQALLD